MKRDDAFYSRRVAVTGSTGMIGSHLVAELVRAGYTDILLPVRNAKRGSNIGKTFEGLGMAWPAKGVEMAQVELTDTGALTELFRGVDTVFHCAAVIMTGDLTERQLIDNNVAVARSVADASLAAGVKKIVHTSSIVVLSPEGHGHCVTEENEPHADSSSSAYGQSKYYSDLEMKRAQEQGMDVTILYPAVVIGEGDWSLNGSSAMIPIISTGLPVYADGVMAYVDVRDVARSYVAVDSCPQAAGERFIVSGANLSYRELITYGAVSSGRRKPFIRAGKGLVYTAYGIIRALTAMNIMKDRSIKRQNLGSVLWGNSYSGHKIEKVCNFEYTPIEDTIDRVVKSYLREKKNKQ